jgi:hypothetical protein
VPALQIRRQRSRERASRRRGKIVVSELGEGLTIAEEEGLVRGHGFHHRPDQRLRPAAAQARDEIGDPVETIGSGDRR